MGTEQVSYFRFGGFELQAAERRLLAEGQPVALGARAFNLLVVLAERAGKLVSKDELLDLVWPNLVVEENNIQVQVSTLRKLLGAGAIATVPGYGYRFTLDLTREVAEPRLPAATEAHNLPRQVTSFVGRAHALAEIKASIGKTRLLTLVGLGGIGKSRLAVEAAASLMADYVDGVWLVELAPLTDPRLVPQAVASVLGVREVAGRPVVEALLNSIKDRQLLLIIDCCEHLLEACAKLAGQLLEAGARLKILATSRERLNVAGEATYTVQSLAVPDAHQSMALEALKKYDAVHLFTDRALAAHPAFQLTDHNAAGVADICRRVEGIPLAIELAAARLRGMSVESLAERLSDRFRLLTRGDPTAAPRQRTLRALIDWSYDLLSEHERALLRRLAVFAGGWTLEAAEAVASADEVAAVDVLDVLTDLIEKSLVVMDADGGRYRLLDTVREYARERLDESGEGDDTHARHLAFYLALVDDLDNRIRDPEFGARLTRLYLELENFLVAHAWCDRAPNGGQLGLRLVRWLWNSWAHHGLAEVVHRVTAEALSRPGAAERNSWRCGALASAGHACFFLGRFEEARGYLEELLSIAQDIGDTGHVGRAHEHLGMVLQAVGQASTARPHFQQNLAIARALGDERRLFSALNSMAELQRGEGELDAAESLYQEALAIGRQYGGPDDIETVLVNLAMTRIGLGASDGVPDKLLEAMEIGEKIDSTWVGADVVEVTAGLSTLLGQCERAARLYGASDAQLARMGFRRQAADQAFLTPLIARAREALGASAFAAAEAAGRILSADAALAEARAWLLEVRNPIAAGSEPRTDVDKIKNAFAPF
jgi:predicted ATPase/DNA-binding winged helix-turn-helix (wHTH) protein